MINKTRLAALALLLTASCNNNSDSNPLSPDATPEYDAQGGAPDAMPEAPTSTVISVSGDYNGNGVLTKISIPSMEVTINAVAGVVGGDPVVRAHGDTLVILDRFGGDSATVLDRNLDLIAQVSTGAGSNPYDSAIIGNTLYIAAFNTAGVLVFDLGDLSAGIKKTIDLSSLDTIDHLPNCNSIFSVGTRLYVSCQRLSESFAPRGIGQVVVIDTTNNDAIEAVLDLHANNPVALFQQAENGDLLLSSAPGAIFGGANDAGCVERISTGATPVVEACLTSNVTLNAYPRQVLPFQGGVAFVSVSSFSESEVRSVNGTTVTPLNLSNVGTNIGNIALCPTGQLVVDDNTMDARGIRVYGANLTPLGANPIDVGWPSVFSPGNSTICW